MPEQFANHPGTALSAAITSTTRPVTFSVASVANLPTQGNFRVLIDAEIFLITNISGTTLTGSNAEGTAAATHASGANVLHILTAGAIAQLETDAGNALLAAGGTFGAPVGFSNPANIAFGSNWQSWTPTVSGSGSMTVSGVTIAEALYLRIGPIVYYKAYISLTTGGTASNQITVSLPVAAIANAITSAGTATVGPAYTSAISFIYPAGGVIQVLNSGLTNFGLGNIIIQISGFFRAA